MPGTRWFPDARLNWAEHALRFDGRDPGEVMIIARSETRERVALTGDELRDAVARARVGLERLGVGPGDRVAAYLPNVPEAVIGLLAAASLGATWTSCAPEFGTRSVVDRLAQVEPKVLLAVDGYRYNGRSVPRSEQVAEIRAALPSLRATVLLPYLDPGADATGCDDLGGADRGAGRARVRIGRVRPSAVRPLQLGHDRAAEADRPRPRRHPPRAPQGARPAARPRACRPVLLVQHDRLDDVELPRVGPDRRLVHRAARRIAGPSRPRKPVAHGGRGGGHVLRDVGAVPHGLPAPGPSAA